MGDYTTQFYGIIVSYYKESLLNNQDSTESKARFFRGENVPFFGCGCGKHHGLTAECERNPTCFLVMFKGDMHCLNISNLC